MKEVLYIVNVERTKKGTEAVVLATLTRENNQYCYEPYNLDKDFTPRTESIVVSKMLPSIAKRRLYSSRRPDIREILAKYGLTTYDEWELLKRTKGILMTDNIMYLTKEELDTLKYSKDLISFIGIEESVSLA